LSGVLILQDHIRNDVAVRSIAENHFPKARFWLTSE
jgi:hypothetical protein